ncbi:MAG TPA: cbb3-type cytochrome c oxidase subunit 3 [Candidatus Kapabacteria bacterium]|nr:cbb3-type cytochrome c oxidase subunit 3 [Candidatus Kapabacteria bacterium]
MFKHLYSNLEHFAIFPILAMLIFMAVFIGVVIFAYKMKKSTVDYISNLPLEDDESKSKNGEN